MGEPHKTSHMSQYPEMSNNHLISMQSHNVYIFWIDLNVADFTDPRMMSPSQCPLALVTEIFCCHHLFGVVVKFVLSSFFCYSIKCDAIFCFYNRACVHCSTIFIK